MRKLLLPLIVLGCISYSAVAQQAAPAPGQVPLPQLPKAEWPTPQQRFEQAVGLMRKGQYDRALVVLQSLAVSNPTFAVYSNISLAAAEVGDAEKALAAVEQYLQMAPNSVVMHSRRIQALQALGRLEERDRARQEIVRLWKSGADKEFGDQPVYVREKWYAGEGADRERIVALEYFEPQPPWRRQYTFMAMDQGGKVRYKVTLESPDATNQAALERGERKADVRLYSLDGYQEQGKQLLHDTWQFFAGEPSYEVVRAEALEVLAGKRKPLSSSTRAVTPASD